METPTLLFTDIEGSTALYERVGAVFRSALALHHALLRAEVARHGGEMLRDTGDGVIAAFADPARAIACAVAAQQALDSAEWPPETGPLRVRMGVHRGPAVFEDGDYRGLVMHHATRVMGAAHGGQVLCSAAVADVLPEGVAELRDLGLYRLKGVPAPMRLFEIARADMHAPFPPPNAPPAFTHRLPVAPTKYFGRDAEIADLFELLRPLPQTAERAHGRLVTVLGPGGTGKTRITLEVAARLLPEYSHAVWFVPLADVREPALILEKIREALGLAAEPGVSALDQAAQFLAAQPSLLVLDNLEQLLPGGALPVNELLAAAPSAACLVSSRVRLDLGCEQEFSLQPLRLPAANASRGELLDFASVQLFVDRARAVRREFALTDENAHGIAQLCRALEGIPLAIELAAARAAVLTPQQMLARLGQRLDFLAGGRADLPERHRTLRAAIAWSYELLSEPLQRLFVRLSVFRGGWTLEAAEAIGGEDGEPVPLVLDRLGELRACSLISADEAAGGMRFRMLEVLREYAAERLSHTDEAPAIAARHHLWFTALAFEREGEDEAARLRTLDTEHDNLRAVLAGIGSPDERARVALSLWEFWMLRGHLSEGRRWFARLLTEISPGERHGAVANAAGILAWKAGDLGEARRLFEAALEFWQDSGDEMALAGILNNLGILADAQEDFSTARASYERSLGLYRRSGTASQIATVLSNIGSNAIMSSHLDEARAPLEEALRLQRELGEQFYYANTLHNLSDLHSRLGDCAAARRLMAECVQVRERLGATDTDFLALTTLAQFALAEENPAAATLLLGAAQKAADDRGIQSVTVLRENGEMMNQLRRLMGAAPFAELCRRGQTFQIGRVLDPDGAWSPGFRASCTTNLERN